MASLGLGYDARLCMFYLCMVPSLPYVFSLRARACVFVCVQDTTDRTSAPSTDVVLPSGESVEGKPLSQSTT